MTTSSKNTILSKILFKILEENNVIQTAINYRKKCFYLFFSFLSAGQGSIRNKKKQNFGG